MQNQNIEPLNDDSLNSLYCIGYNLYRNGKYTDARDFFRFLSIIKADDRRYWLGLGACCQMMKNYPTALESYSVAAILNPNDPYVHFYAAECTYHSGDIPKAIATLESALTVAAQSDTHSTLKTKLDHLHDTWSRMTEGVSCD